jgi:hypothetical protein
MIKYENSKELFECEINWENWNRIVEQTRRDIAELLKDYKQPTKLARHETSYIYNKDGELVKEFETQLDCARFLGGNKATVSNYLKRQWNYNGYLLSLEELRPDIAFALHRYNREHGYIFIHGDTKKRIPIYSYNADGKLVGAYETQYKWAKVTKKGNTFIKKADRIVNERLVSKNRYDEATAKQKFKETLAKEPILLSVYIYNADGELIRENAPTRVIRELTQCSYNKIYNNFAIKPYYYDCGYIISKQQLTPSEVQEIALKGSNFTRK